MNSSVGAGILNIVTESLYDKPIVVFREYIQNAADALCNVTDCDAKELSAHIWIDNNNLCFIDNGTGIDENKFLERMTVIANSSKVKTKNMGYKGIGRLSGMSYCKKLTFINIIDYSSSNFQLYTIDVEKYNEIQKTEEFGGMSIEKLMEIIGEYTKEIDEEKYDLLLKKQFLFQKRNTGFLVILQDISSVLKTTINENSFNESLSWLLPVSFKKELLEHEEFGELFESLTVSDDKNKLYSVPARSFDIYYQEELIKRPLDSSMFRTFVCKNNFGKYAVGLNTFSNHKIEIDKKNGFSGIRIYIDNILLCDENELIPALHNYGLITHGLYETIQTVKGIGAMIYITDKVNISANARRTFIEITDSNSIEFMELLAEFVNNIYEARYALSKYFSAVKKNDDDAIKIETLKEKALKTLAVLTSDEIILAEENKPIHFCEMSKTERQRAVKSKISQVFNEFLKKYMSQTDDYDFDSCFNDFVVWLNANNE